MNPRLLLAPTFPQLERRFLADLTEACAEAPFAPKWVIVPNATLANHLRARLAHAADARALAGVRVANLPVFTARLGEGLGVGVTARWGILHDLLLEEIVAGLPKDSPLARLREISGGGRFLRDSFSDLANGGFGLANLDRVCELAGDREFAFEPREREVLRLFVRFVEILAKREISWGPLVLQGLKEKIEGASSEKIAEALAAREGQTPQVFVYGFYEWLDVHLGWLTVLAEKVLSRIYYPRGKMEGEAQPAYAFAEEMIETLRHRFSSLDSEEIEGDPGVCGRFFLKNFSETPPAGLTWQRACGLRAEAISAALRIRGWLEEGLPPEEILVTAPRAEGYGEALRAVFREFGIPLRVSDLPAGMTPADEALRFLARIWEEKAPAEWVFALLRAAPLPPAAKGVDVDVFEAKARKLGIWGGETWRAFAERQGANAPSPEEKRLIEAIGVLSEDRRASTEEMSIEAAREIFERMAREWLAEASGMKDLLEGLRRMARVSPGLRLELREWAALLAGEVAPRTLRDPPSRSVLFAPMMRARGLTAKGLVFLGLAAGEMPRRMEDHPLLSEAARGRIARAAEQIGHRLPMATRVTEEMRLLFQLLNTAAERVHWVVPETDATGRAVAPTPWVQRFLRRWEKSDATAQSDRLPPSAKLQAVWLLARDETLGSALPPSFARYLDPALADSACEDEDGQRLAASVERRGRRLEWSGAIGERFAAEKLRATQLERLAECPFRFWCEEIEGIDSLDVLAPAYALAPMPHGTFVHAILEGAVRPHLEKKKLSEIAEEMLAREGAQLFALAEKIAQQRNDVSDALALLPKAFRDAEVRDAVELVSRYFRWAILNAGEARPMQVEVPVEKCRSGRPRISGKIDQIDQTPDGKVILDFKSGKRPKGKRYSVAVRLGWSAQAALYPWMLGEEEARFQYLYLGGDEIEAGEAEDAPSAEALLADLDLFLEKGFYPATSIQTVAAMGRMIEKDVPGCDFCRLASVCRKFEAGRVARQARLLDEHAPKRAEAFRALVGMAAKRVKR